MRVPSFLILMACLVLGCQEEPMTLEETLADPHLALSTKAYKVLELSYDGRYDDMRDLFEPEAIKGVTDAGFRVFFDSVGAITNRLGSIPSEGRFVDPRYRILSVEHDTSNTYTVVLPLGDPRPSTDKYFYIVQVTAAGKINSFQLTPIEEDEPQ